MKLPYKRGDSFAMPLGNGQFAPSYIVACEHRVVVVAVTVGDDAPLVLRVSDDALVLHRWKRNGRVTPDESLVAQNQYWMAASRAERLAAAAHGAPHPRERRIRVHEIRNDDATQGFAEIDDDSILALTERLEPQRLTAVINTLHDHPGVMVRLHGASVQQLVSIAPSSVRRLTLGTSTESLPQTPHVRELVLIGEYDLSRVADAFPNVESLIVDAASANIDISVLGRLENLEHLQLLHGKLTKRSSGDAWPAVRSLRISRVSGMSRLDLLETPVLRALAIEHLPELESVKPLQEVETLEQLELIGLWQFAIADVEWTLERRSLVRAEIDIGGRRKNVELYRRANWAYPWPLSS